MNTKKISLFFSALALSLSIGFAQRARVHILATGGTIAGVGASATQSNYTAGQVAIGTLLDAVPEIQELAEVSGEQVVRIGSQDMSDEVWLILAKRINQLLAQDDVDAVVITHGTDTMEETAYFLHLTVHSDKPVVLVGAMRPSTAISADGPLNLYNAVAVAADKQSKGRGVLVAMNGFVLDARNVVKTSTTGVETFQSPNAGPVATIFNSRVNYLSQAEKKHTTASVFSVDELQSLPKVGIVYSHSNIYADAAEAFLNNNYRGIVHAGVGNGNIHKNVFPVLEKAGREGIVVVRSSRIASGATTLDAEVDDAHYGFVASQDLNPQKARILLMLALTKTSDREAIQEYFNTY